MQNGCWQKKLSGNTQGRIQGGGGEEEAKAPGPHTLNLAQTLFKNKETMFCLSQLHLRLDPIDDVIGSYYPIPTTDNFKA